MTHIIMPVDAAKHLRQIFIKTAGDLGYPFRNVIEACLSILSDVHKHLPRKERQDFAQLLRTFAASLESEHK